jgi:hypothetical protein
MTTQVPSFEGGAGLDSSYNEVNLGAALRDMITNIKSFTATKEDMNWVVDYVNGVSPPDGTVITTQAEYDALGYPLKYVQDYARIVPDAIAHRIIVDCVAGNHYSRPGTEPLYGGVFLSVAHRLLAARAGNVDSTKALRAAGVMFRGVRLYVHEDVAVTIASGATGTTVTRSAGTWDADLANKTVVVTSGTGLGQRAKIVSRTDTVLTCAGKLTAGSVTVSVYDCATKWIPSADGGTTFQTYALNVGTTPFSDTGITFEDLQIGSTSHPCYFATIGKIIFNGCNLHGSLSNTAKASELYFNYSYLEVPVALWNGMVLGCHSSLKSSIVYGNAGDGHLVWFYPGTVHNIEGCYFIPETSYAGVVLDSYYAELVDFGGHPSFINGNTLCTGVKVQKNSTLVDTDILYLVDCAIGHHQVGCSLNISGYKGSGNALIFKLEGGAQLYYNYSTTVVTGTLWSNIDGTDYAASNFAARGDTVTGAYGAMALAY